LDNNNCTIIVTMGEKGALIVQKSFESDTEINITHVPAFKVNVVDTTAAGDAFIGGFASKFLESASLLADSQNMQELAPALQKAVRYGCACGALATTKFGAQPSLPTKEEVERFMSLQ
jgi:sugar/nucleoside kinase (ribokinase family)